MRRDDPTFLRSFPRYYAADDAAPRSPQAQSSQAGTSDATQHGAGAGAAPNAGDDAKWQEWAAAYMARLNCARDEGIKANG